MKNWEELIEDTKDGMYNHFSFDFWSTIAFSNAMFKTKRRELLSKLMINPDLNQIDHAFATIGLSYNKSMESDNFIKSPTSLYEEVFKLLQIDSSSVKLTKIKIEALFHAHPPIFSSGFLKFYQHISNFQCTKSITSNTAFISGKVIEDTIFHNRPDLEFNFMFFSDLVACAKPSIEMFNLVKANAKLLHSDSIDIRMLHIGDNAITDFEGAKKFGIDAALINI
jgi:putative hydrolase of the HAD superfamily